MRLRVFVFVFILALLLLNCKKNKETSFLQENQVRITQPRLVATNQFIDSVAILTANLKLEGAKIYYTDNGENPTEKSTAYTKPIKVFKPGVYKFKAYHTDWKPSKIVEKVFYKRGFPIEKIVWDTKPSKKYKGVGLSTLNNNQKAGIDFKDEQWLGFDTIAKASLTLKNVTFVKSLNIGYLKDPGSWIFPPERIKVETSKDGIHFKNKTIEIQPLEKVSSISIEYADIEINEDIKFLRVEVRNTASIPDWHEGKGTKGWLFMDEWILK
ncbi:chitobiase/beta-hexosaminidase C-terminal domain-containing protein [Polaribacter cellanae]|uniref:Chitobiase/beta-hexosaminidase C-terminal domain-containing protein n=1 Tax=Polaribacter cellanae TaxID=2818493 RepID=A0A975H6P3_9FLAO|nr:chitobiase/beta-hexosaminidase C-terminal domain-containing protein [Polaribacter cellanae]QTE22213.1 chitobiase/beta-hexosaminidase C-terminal domain-containing protein [Polaribacter cellanae]